MYILLFVFSVISDKLFLAHLQTKCSAKLKPNESSLEGRTGTRRKYVSKINKYIDREEGIVDMYQYVCMYVCMLVYVYLVSGFVCVKGKRKYHLQHRLKHFPTNTHKLSPLQTHTHTHTYIQTFVFTPTDAHTNTDLKISHRFCYKQKQQPQQKAKSSLRMSFSRTDCQKDGRTNGWMERLGSVWWVGGVVIK